MNTNTGLKDFFDNTETKLLDIADISSKITEIMIYKNQSDIKKLYNDNPDKYIMHMESQFQDFANTTYGLFRKIISGDNLDFIKEIFAAMENINEVDDNFDDIDKKFQKKLADNFVKDNNNITEIN
jgi:hypothetical protein